jgi:hypothetical protein
MAGGFGEMAAMDAAFQVAQQDAALYARSAEFNATMQNQFSLAEQAFIHNAMLSDQSYQQARELQTQRLSAQMEAIILDYKGRSALMDKELDQWFLTAAQSHEYNLDLLWEQASVTEGQAGRDFARTMTLNGMLQMTNFYTMAFQSVLQYANNPNFTPEQQAAAMREGMMWASQQFDFIQSFWGQWGAGGPPGSSSGLGFSSSDALASWWDFNTTPQWWQQAGGQTTPQGAGFMGGTVTV